MKFVDEARINVRSGKGGNGAATFRREAFVPRGGPSGGDGGDGGSVVLVVDQQLCTLLDFKYHQHYWAKDGENGGSKDCNGARGADLTVRVPVGTVVWDDKTGDLLADLASAEQRFVVCRGGKGGRGNIHFKTPWNQTPAEAEPGFPSEEKVIRLELKLIAQAGIIGYPNVGKSSLIAAVSRARPKIADYPFTTLVPSLGVAALSAERTLVVADIPGLIEGAAEGVGLGHRFLRHVERARVLIHLLALSPEPDREPERDFDVIMGELRRHDPFLAEKPQVVALNKIDLPEARAAFAELHSRFARRGIDLVPISAATHEGLTVLLERTWKLLSEAPPSE
ncbi:MAG: GTPase ObgE [Pseudomonadota bacterium]